MGGFCPPPQDFKKPGLNRVNLCNVVKSGTVNKWPLNEKPCQNTQNAVKTILLARSLKIWGPNQELY